MVFQRGTEHKGDIVFATLNKIIPILFTNLYEGFCNSQVCYLYWTAQDQLQPTEIFCIFVHHIIAENAQDTNAAILQFQLRQQCILAQRTFLKVSGTF